MIFLRPVLILSIFSISIMNLRASNDQEKPQMSPSSLTAQEKKSKAASVMAEKLTALNSKINPDADWRNQNDWANHLFDEDQDDQQHNQSQLQQQAKIEEANDTDSTDHSHEKVKSVNGTTSFFEGLYNTAENSIQPSDDKTNEETKSVSSDTTASNTPIPSLTKSYTDQEKEAAIKIQSMYRGFANRQVQKILQDLADQDLADMDAQEEKLSGDLTIYSKDPLDSSDRSFADNEQAMQINLTDLTPANLARYNNNYLKKNNPDKYAQALKQKEEKAAREAELAQLLDEKLVQGIFDNLTPEELVNLVKYPMKDELSSKEFKEALKRKAIQNPAAVQGLVNLAQEDATAYQYLLHIPNNSNSSSSDNALITFNEAAVQNILKDCE